MDGFNEVEDHLDRLEDYHMSHLQGPAYSVNDKDQESPNSMMILAQKVKVGTLQIVMNGQMLHQGVDFDTEGEEGVIGNVNFNFDVESDDVFDFWGVVKPDTIEYDGGY